MFSAAFKEMSVFVKLQLLGYKFYVIFYNDVMEPVHILQWKTVPERTSSVELCF